MIVADEHGEVVVEIIDSVDRVVKEKEEGVPFTTLHDYIDAMSIQLDLVENHKTKSNERRKAIFDLACLCVSALSKYGMS